MEIRGDGAALTLYDAVGGQQFFIDLVDRFYEGVETDRLLRHMYPDDLEAPRAHTAAFLVQYWGGPTTYSEQRGHPRLRMRHARFEIGEAERNAWLGHMLAAVDSLRPQPEIERALKEYFSMASTHMINTAG